MKVFHVTTRHRAFDILGHGFGEQDEVCVTATLRGVRLLATVLVDRFKPADVVAADGLLALREDFDPSEWERLPAACIHDPVGDIALEIEFPPDINLDEYQYQESVVLWNKRTQETHITDEFEWTGEYLVPLDVARRAWVTQFLEANLSAEDEALVAERVAAFFWRAALGGAVRARTGDRSTPVPVRRRSAPAKPPEQGPDVVS